MWLSDLSKHTQQLTCNQSRVVSGDHVVKPANSCPSLSCYAVSILPHGLQSVSRLNTELALNPLSPHDALKHHFTFLKTDLIFLQPRDLEWKFRWNWQFLLLFSPTTSRELRQQFAACSGWRWQCKVRLERVKQSLLTISARGPILYIRIWRQ